MLASLSKTKKVYFGSISVAFCLGIFMGAKLGKSAAPSGNHHERNSGKTSERKNDASSPEAVMVSSGSSPNKNASSVDSQIHAAEKAHHNLALQNPQESLQNALQEPEGTLRDRAILSAMNIWAEQNAPSAFRWLTQNQDKLSNITDVYSVIMAQHINNDPQSAGKLIKQMEGGTLKTSFAGQIAFALSEKDPQESLIWSETLNDPAARKQAIEISIQALAQNNEKDALEYALGEPSPELRAQFADQVALVMARNNPHATAKRINEFPEEVQASVAAHVAGALAITAPAETSKWIASMPTGEARDLATERAFQQILKHDNGQAFDLATNVEDPARRYGLIRDSLLELHKVEPELAREMLFETSALDEGQKEFLTSDLQENGTASNLVVP